MKTALSIILFTIFVQPISSNEFQSVSRNGTNLSFLLDRTFLNGFSKGSSKVWLATNEDMVSESNQGLWLLVPNRASFTLFSTPLLFISSFLVENSTFEKASAPSPWWMSWWFLLLLTGLLISIGVACYKHRTYIYKKQRKILEVTVQRRTADLLRANEEIRLQKEELERQRDFLQGSNVELAEKNKEIKAQAIALEDYSQAIERMNKELQKANESLDTKVTRRTQNLEKAHKELDNFVYRVSHDIRAPLSSMLGLLQLIDSSSSMQESKNYLGYIEQNINKLDKFVKDILDYSQNSRIPSKWQEVDFGLLVSELLEELQFISGYDQVTISYPKEKEVLFASDVYRLKIVMRNLVSNAINYHNPYTAQPKVDILFDHTPGGPIITVRDNGLGIPKELLPSIFNMFCRASDTSNGSGLGLYIVKEALEKMGGSIAVTSQEGKGTCFQIALMEEAVGVPQEGLL